MDLIHKHISLVQDNINAVIRELNCRSAAHDLSKFSEEERPLVDNKPLLNEAEYMSDEYMTLLEQVKPALLTHYHNNSHHPQHYTDGIYGMDMLDLLEMLADWKAACEESKDGDFASSFKANISRFNINDELSSLLRKTCQGIGWL